MVAGQISIATVADKNIAVWLEKRTSLGRRGDPYPERVAYFFDSRIPFSKTSVADKLGQWCEWEPGPGPTLIEDKSFSAFSLNSVFRIEATAVSNDDSTFSSPRRS